MLKKLTDVTGNLLNKTITGAGQIAGAGIEKAGLEKTAEWIRETSEKTGQVSHGSLKITGQFVEGSFHALKGKIQHDNTTYENGVSDILTSSRTLIKGVGELVKNSAVQSYDAVDGLAKKDYDRAKAAAWKLSQTLAVSLTAISVIDIVNKNDVAEAKNIQSLNTSLENDVHPITEVPFERNEIDYNGQIISDVFPVFDCQFTAVIAPSDYLASDAEHFTEANAQLAEAIEANPQLATDIGLTRGDVAMLQLNVTPEGYTWHHHEQPGQLQLVHSDLHNQTAHTGGRFIWGGGSAYRA